MIPCPHCGVVLQQVRADGRCAGCGKLLPEGQRAAPAPPAPTVAAPLAAPSPNWQAIKRQCEANSTQRFSLRSHPDYGFYTGSLPDTRQVLIACGDDGRTVTVLFDTEGILVEVIPGELPSPQQFLDAGDKAAVEENDYGGYLHRAMNLNSGVIRVKAFCLPDAELAVYELPESLQGYRDHPSNPNLEEEERTRLGEFFREWKDRGQFVLLWGNEYWLDKSGEVVSS